MVKSSVCQPFTLTTKVQKHHLATWPAAEQCTERKGAVGVGGGASCVSDPSAIWFRQKSPGSFTLRSTWTNQNFIFPQTLDLSTKNPENAVDPWTTRWLRVPTSPCNWNLLLSPKCGCPSVSTGDRSQDSPQKPKSVDVRVPYRKQHTSMHTVSLLHLQAPTHWSKTVQAFTEKFKNPCQVDLHSLCCSRVNCIFFVFSSPHPTFLLPGPQSQPSPNFREGKLGQVFLEFFCALSWNLQSHHSASRIFLPASPAWSDQSQARLKFFPFLEPDAATERDPVLARTQTLLGIYPTRDQAELTHRGTGSREQPGGPGILL